MNNNIFKKSEHDEAKVIIDWAGYNIAQYPQLNYLFAIVNGAKLTWGINQDGKRYSKEAMNLKDEGLRRGVLDYCLPFPIMGYNALFLELKVNENIPSVYQLDYIEYLNRNHYYACCCWGADAAIWVISHYINSDFIDHFTQKRFFGFENGIKEKLIKEIHKIEDIRRGNNLLAFL